MLAKNEDYVDLSRPSIPGLIYALRHKEVWPSDFRWFFPDCRRCAIGLARALWPQHIGISTSYDVLDALGIKAEGDDQPLWYRNPRIEGWRMTFMHGNADTQPEQIADRLEGRAAQELLQQALALA